MSLLVDAAPASPTSSSSERSLPEGYMEDLDIVTDWVNEILGIELDSETFTESLQNGVILCNVANTLSKSARLAGCTNPPPSGIRRFHRGCAAESIQARDNVSSFSMWCMLYGVPPVLIPCADDVSMGRNTASAISLLLFLIRKSASYSTSACPRDRSHSSTGSFTERVNRRSFSRGRSYDCFSDAMMERQKSTCRTRSESIDSETSSSSMGSLRAQPFLYEHINDNGHEANTLIKDLNLACRNISKKVVVSNFEIPGFEHQELCIDKTLESESQAFLRRQNRLFRKSNTVANIETGKRRFVLKSPGRKPGDLDISQELLSVEDMEYLLVSTTDSIVNKLRAVFKLLALRVIGAQSRDSSLTPLELSLSLTNNVYPSYTFTTHSSTARQVAFSNLRSLLVTRFADNAHVRFEEVYEIWNRKYSACMEDEMA